MRIKHLLFFFILSLPTSAKRHATQAVDRKNVDQENTQLEDVSLPTAQDTFYQLALEIQNNFIYMFSDYLSLEDPAPQDVQPRPEQKTFHKCFSFYNRNANEHMFSICIDWNSDSQELVLKVQNAGQLNLSKVFRPWDLRELVAQMAIFQDAIWHSLRYNPFWRSRQMHVNLFNDIKNELARKIPGLEFEVGANPVDTLDAPFFSYRMRHHNMYLGNVRFAMSASQEQKDVGDLSLSRNQLITVEFDVTKDNQLQTGQLGLAAIADGSKSYDDFMKTVISAVDFDNQFNDLDQLFQMVKKYLVKSYPKIKIIEKPAQTTDPLFENRYYSIEHEFSKLEMYIGSSQSSETGTMFTLMIDEHGGQFQTPRAQTKLGRSSQQVLDQMLDRMGVGQMMKSIKDTVMDICKESYESYRVIAVHELNKKDHGDMVPFSESPLMGKHYAGLKNKEFKCGLVEEAGKRTKAHFILSSVSNEYHYRFFFYMDSFNKKLMQRTIQNFFDSQVY